MFDHGDAGGGHSHGVHDHHHADAASGDQAAVQAQRRAAARKLTIVAGLTLAFMVVEFVGGALTHSLALISDAGHMFVDASALMLAALMARLAARPPDPRRTFGYRRAEVLGAFVNGTLLCGLVLFIVWEAVHRLFSPEQIKGEAMLWIAVAGLAFNLAAAAILMGGGRKDRDLNMRGALVHVMSDALGSVGAIIAAVCVIWFDFMLADALVGLLVAALIAFNAVRLLRSTLGILLEGVPRNLDVMQIQRDVAALDGIVSVHDIHVWSTAPGEETMTLHVVLRDMEELKRWDEHLLRINSLLRDKYKLVHNIIQPELREELHHEIQHVAGVSERLPEL